MIDAYKRILVAIDGSENSMSAFHHAVSVAKRNQASLYILQVISLQAGEYSPYSLGGSMQQEEQIEIENEMLKNVAYALENGASDVLPVVLIDNPKTCIATTIPDKYAIDLIIIGATGRGAVNRLMIGSTTNYVVQHAKCNVLVIKHKHDTL